DFLFSLLITFSWVQVSLYVLHYASPWVQHISRVGCAAVLWIPACIPMGIEWFSFQIVMSLTDHDSLLPLIPFLLWTGLHVLLTRFSDGPAGYVQSAKSDDSEPSFEEGVPEIVIDEQSTADSISVFST
ncbi:unnamed protein product, partial [Symbiodinium pilosum]